MEYFIKVFFPLKQSYTTASNNMATTSTSTTFEDSIQSSMTTTEPITAHDSKIKSMTIRVEDPQKQSTTVVQGFISYLVTTEVSFSFFFPLLYPT